MSNNMTKKDRDFEVLKYLSNKKKRLVNYLNGNHPMPTTRREFMACGLISMSAHIAAPTLLQLISASAWGQTNQIECPTSGSSGGAGGVGRPLFVHVQLSGGAALFAQHHQRGANGAPLPSYGRMGVGPNPTVQTRFANQAPFVGESQFFQAMETQLANTSVYQNASFVSVAAASNDDTSNNAHDVSGLLEAAGIIGEKLPTAVTGSNGSRFRGAVFPAATLLRVQSANDMTGALGVAGALGRFPGNAQEQNALHVSLVTLIENLNKNQVEALAADPGSHSSQATFKQLIQCAAQKNVQNMSSQENVDFLDGSVPQFADGGAGYAAAFAGAGAEFTAAGQAVGAGLVGLTGAVLIQMGGFDYHLGGRRAEANADDARAGQMVGRILRGAEAAGKAVFIMVSSDGSVSSPNDDGAGNNVDWRGDSGRRGSAYMIAYSPAGAPVATGFQSGNYADAAFQLNHFQGTEVAGQNPIAALDAQQLMGSAVFLNYLAASNQHALIDQAALGPVKALLSGSVPAGSGTMFDYFTRFNRG